MQAAIWNRSPKSWFFGQAAQANESGSDSSDSEDSGSSSEEESPRGGPVNNRTSQEVGGDWQNAVGGGGKVFQQYVGYRKYSTPLPGAAGSPQKYAQQMPASGGSPQKYSTPLPGAAGSPQKYAQQMPAFGGSPQYKIVNGRVQQVAPVKLVDNFQYAGRSPVTAVRGVGGPPTFQLQPVPGTYVAPELPEKPQGLTTSPYEGGGEIFWVDGRKFEMCGALGQGSFGSVFEAHELYPNTMKKIGGPTVAVKRACPNKQELLEAALLEAEILKRLAVVPGEGFVPRYVAHGKIRGTSNGAGAQVVTAMTKLAGEPLDRWLYGIDEQALKTVRVRDMVDGTLPGNCGTRNLGEAADLTLELLKTILPVFVALQKFAFHRDISAHNFLIVDHGLSKNWAKFAVLDFGLAVRADVWRREWGFRNIAGDPRYFAPSAWMQLSCGHKYVAEHPKSVWVKQYQYRLDHYAFGMLLLEMLFALWKGPEDPEWKDCDEETGPTAAWRSNFLVARQAWRSYWTVCVGFFQQFHTGGAHALRELFLAKNQKSNQLKIEDFGDNLYAVAKDIRDAAQNAPEGDTYKKVSFLLETCADLICPDSKVRWQEISFNMVDLFEEPSKLRRRGRNKRFVTEPASSFTRVAQIAAEVEESSEEGQPYVQATSSGSSMGSEYLVAKVGSNYSDGAHKLDLKVSGQKSHKRVWTEMVQGVLPEVGILKE